MSDGLGMILLSLPAKIGQLAALQTLNLGGCDELKSLPAELTAVLESNGTKVTK